jgi:hypothetical protein
MPKCTDDKIDFGRVGRRVIEADFSGGDLSSEGGVLLRCRMDQRLGLTAAAAAALGDGRQTGKVRHSLASMVAQRVYGLCLGWADVCDHNALRADLAMQTAVGRDQALASAPTLSRLETAATPEQAWALHRVLLEQFIASRRGKRAPRELVLDVDATHVPLHGAQERVFFHGYYDNYCYLPLYVFCGQAGCRVPGACVVGLRRRCRGAARRHDLLPVDPPQSPPLAAGLGARCVGIGRAGAAVSDCVRCLSYDAMCRIGPPQEPGVVQWVGMTLEPGDILFTGTPAGVGVANIPPRFLKPGDVVRCEIDKLGHIEGTMVAEA